MMFAHSIRTFRRSFGDAALRRAGWCYSGLLGLLILSFFAACKDAKKEPARGQLMVILQTDMSLPKDIKKVRVQILQEGSLKHDVSYKVSPDGKIALPASLAVVAGKKPKPTVEVRVMGIRGSEVRVFTKVITTIPRSRIATLHVPIQWLCVGQLVDLGNNTYDTDCEDDKDGNEQTCRAGSCVKAEIPESELRTYEPEDVFGGGASPTDELGQCFPTAEVFDAGFNVVPDENCRVEFAVPEGQQPNLALAMGERSEGVDGICGELNCYIPLDKHELLGWSVVKTTEGDDGVVLIAQLPLAICGSVIAEQVRSVRASTLFQTKTPSWPTCGDWSTVGEEAPKPKLGQGQPITSDGRGAAETDSGVPDDGALTPDAAVAATVDIEYDVASEDSTHDVDIGGALQLRLIIPGDAGAPSPEQVVWSSESTDVAVVDEDGLVSGVSSGTTQIIASLDGEEIRFEITVDRGPPVALQLDDAQVTASPELTAVAGTTGACANLSENAEVIAVPEGCQVRLPAQASYVDETTQTVTKDVVWTVSDSALASVSETGVVSTLGQGEVTITASFGGQIQEVRVDVQPAALVAMSIGQDTTITLETGLAQLVATGLFTNSGGEFIDISDQVTWGSTDASIVVVDDNGVAHGLTNGTADVTATLGNITSSAPFAVTVIVPPSADAGAP